MHRFALIVLVGGGALLTAGPALGQANNPPNPAQPPVVPGARTQPELIAQPGIPQTPFFNDPAIRQQLKLSKEQFDALNKAYSEHWSRVVTDTRNLAAMKEQERVRRLQELTGTFQSDFGKSTQSVLQAEQQARFGQLLLQSQGFNAFNDPLLQRRLNLTVKQLADLRAFSQQFDQQLILLQKAAQDDRAGATRRFLELRRQMGEQIGSVLTDPQRQTWLQLTGDPFGFPLQVNPPVQNSTTPTPQPAPVPPPQPQR